MFSGKSSTPASDWGFQFLSTLSTLPYFLPSPAWVLSSPLFTKRSLDPGANSQILPENYLIWELIFLRCLVLARPWCQTHRNPGGHVAWWKKNTEGVTVEMHLPDLRL